MAVTSRPSAESGESNAPELTAWQAMRARAAARSYQRLARSDLLSEIVGSALLIRSKMPGRGESARLTDLLVAGRRLRSRPLRSVARRFLESWLEPQRVETFRAQQLGWNYYRNDFGGLSSPGLTCSLVLKAPGPNGEKGVLYSSFEYNWMRLVANYDAKRFFKDYFLVGASSWSPPDYAAFGSLAGLSPDPVFIGISNTADIEHYRLFEPYVRGVPLLASDWIMPEQFSPKPVADRTIDILMVANWLRFKRHWLLFEALRQMDRRLRVVLIGRNGEARTEQSIREELRAFGVKQDVELLTDVGIDEVYAHQCNAKVAAIFSRREGSCVAVAECLFADTPVAMMRDAHVGSKAYINDATGVITARRHIAGDLSRLLERPSGLAPRQWALDHITCYESSRRLNEQLRAYSLRAGLPWTNDIAPLQWKSIPRYVRLEDEGRLEPAVKQLRTEYGIPLV